MEREHVFADPRWCFTETKHRDHNTETTQKQQHTTNSTPVLKRYECNQPGGG